VGRGREVLEIVMKPLGIASTLAIACVAVLTNHSVRAEPRAVIELFTSQGCSSCPAADKLAAEFAVDPSMLVMSLAVDYWDYLGWKDTLALSGHTSRQRAYARARGDREVYTPQAVVNGVAHVLGSDKAAIEKAIRKTRDTAAPLTIPITLTIADDKVAVNVPGSANEKPHGEVWLCPITRKVPVTIGRGENHGRTITYTNVVRRWVKLGDWAGKAVTFALPLKDLQTGAIDSLAVLVQNGATSSPKVIMGAAQVAIR
jgi:hypothetical protein